MAATATLPLAFTEIRAPFQKPLQNGISFPLIISPSPEYAKKDAEGLADTLKKHKEWLEEEIVRYGAVLFRGFQIYTPQDFNLILEYLDWEEFPYLSGGGAAPRKRVYGRVMTANDGIPFNQYIGFHNEAAYLQETPKRVLFFCEKPPEPGTGGATPIVLGHVIYKRVLENEELKKKLLNKGPVHLVHLLTEEDWRARYSTDDKQVAETKAKMENIPNLHWLQNGGAKVLMGPLSPLFKEDTAGRMSLFSSLGSLVELNKVYPNKVHNTLLIWPKREPAQHTHTHTQFVNQVTLELGDGTEVTEEMMLALVRIMREEEVAFPWEKGDILFVDNSAVLHSRQVCSSPDRSILVSVTK